MLIKKTVIKILTFEFFFSLLPVSPTIAATQLMIAAFDHC